MRVLVLGACLGLGACATIPVSQSQADAAMESGRAILQTELTYASFPRCGPGVSWSAAQPCSTLAGVRALDALSKIVVADVNQLQNQEALGAANFTEVGLLLAAI